MKNLLCVAVFFSCMTPRFHHNVSIYFLLLVLLLIIYFIKGSKTKLKISYTKIKDISVFAIWVLVAIIQLYGSVSINHSLVDIYYLVVGLFSVIALNLIAKDEDTFQKCFGVITLALLIHCAIGCFEIFRTTHLFEVGVIDTLHVGKPVSIFTNNNDFGTFVSLKFYLISLFEYYFLFLLFLRLLGTFVLFRVYLQLLMNFALESLCRKHLVNH